MQNRSYILLLLLLILSACHGQPKTASKLDADAIGRNILGPAIPLSDAKSEDRPEDIVSSLALTRKKAWQIFADTIHSETIAIKSPQGDIKSTQIPRFMTWYSLEDANRLFNKSLEALNEGDKNSGKPIDSEAWKQAENRLVDEIKEMPAPVKKKWENFFNQNSDLNPASVMGASGLSRILFNGDVLASTAEQYASLQACYPEDQSKPAFDTPHKSCFPQGLSPRSITIKTNWLNTTAGFRSYASDADALTSLMQDPDASWDKLRKERAIPETIVQATMNGKAFVLGGMHIVSKEFKDWIWISVWWSESPDTDFGEDRPEFIQKLGAPWNQYKLCAVSSYVQNAAELDELATRYPSLAKAYKAVLNDSGASWCSNPYIERGINNQRTNCIGCHQFAGTDVDQMDVISDASRFPHFGNTKQREDFPSDYVWSATQGQISWLSTLNSLRFPVH